MEVCISFADEEGLLNNEVGWRWIRGKMKIFRIDLFLSFFFYVIIEILSN